MASTAPNRSNSLSLSGRREFTNRVLGERQTTIYLPRSTDHVEPLHSMGPVLGCLEQVNYSTIRPRQLETGNTILPATDGTGETCNSQVQLFGRYRLLTFIHQHPEDAGKYNAEPIIRTASELSWHHTSEG